MTDLPISGLDNASRLTGGEYLGITQRGQSRKTTLGAIAELAQFQKEGANWAVPHRGAHVRRTSDSSALTFPVMGSFQESVYDTDNFWTLAVPTRFTIPAGVTKVRLHAWMQLVGDAGNGGVHAMWYKNGASFVGKGTVSIRQSNAGYAATSIQSISAVIDVVEGDYFEIRCNTTINGSRSLGTDCEMAIEVIEALGATARPYEIHRFVPEELSVSAKVQQIISSRRFVLPIDGGTSQFYLGIAPTANLVLPVQKNGVQFGTLTFASGSNLGVMDCPEMEFQVGDVLSILTPADVFSAADLSLGLVMEV